MSLIEIDLYESDEDKRPTTINVTPPVTDLFGEPTKYPRRIYFVRHAESTWNVPCEEIKTGWNNTKKDVSAASQAAKTDGIKKTMKKSGFNIGDSLKNAASGVFHMTPELMHTDHPISTKGVEQAITLRDQIVNSGSELKEVQHVVCSPLLRAIMTAGNVFPKAKLILEPDARELKESVMQRDCVGAATGVDIISRAHRKGLDPKVRIELGDACKDVWWVQGMNTESPDDIDRRIDRLWNRLIMVGQETDWKLPPVCVTHSNLIRALFRRFARSQKELNHPRSPQQSIELQQLQPLDLLSGDPPDLLSGDPPASGCPSYRSSNPDPVLTDDWEVYKTDETSLLKLQRISNCGVVRITLEDKDIIHCMPDMYAADPSQTKLPQCKSVEIMFGTTLQSD